VAQFLKGLPKGLGSRIFFSFSSVINGGNKLVAHPNEVTLQVASCLDSDIKLVSYLGFEI
jgi:hypothetical protein